MAGAERITIAQSPATCFASQQRINPNLISFKADRYAVFARGLDMEVRDHRPSISTIRRTGRLDTPSMPVSSSARPGRPPQPSWRSFAMRLQSGISRRRPVVQHAHLATAVAFDAQEPRRERTERLGQGLGRRGQRVGAVTAPVALWGRLEGHYGRSFSAATSRFIAGINASALRSLVRCAQSVEHHR
jgi:hypothetical protein